VFISQSLAVMSADADARRTPDGEKLTAVTYPV
jgi:hypothetical protein